MGVCVSIFWYKFLEEFYYHPKLEAFIVTGIGILLSTLLLVALVKLFGDLWGVIILTILYALWISYLFHIGKLFWC